VSARFFVRKIRAYNWAVFRYSNNANQESAKKELYFELKMQFKMQIKPIWTLKLNLGTKTSV